MIGNPRYGRDVAECHETSGLDRRDPHLASLGSDAMASAAMLAETVAAAYYVEEASHLL